MDTQTGKNSRKATKFVTKPLISVGKNLNGRVFTESVLQSVVATSREIS